MIVNVRGTSGSGKSTLTRAVMERYPVRTRVKVAGRKQPIGYIMSGAKEAGTDKALPPLYVVGHYETPCGGCDTIPSLDTIRDHVRQAAEQGMDVFFEGLLISSEFNRTLALAQEYGQDMLVVELDLPLQECLDSVNGRRRAKRGADAPGVNPKNTESKWKGTRSTVNKLEAAGVKVRRGGREAALGFVLEHLGHAR